MNRSKKSLLIALLAIFVVTLCIAVACEREPSEYTVTFVANGEIVYTESFTKDNKNITEPRVPTKIGYIGAWEEYTLGDSDLTVNAIYTPKTYIATLDYDGADGNIGATQVTLTYNRPVGELPSPTKTGYEFTGWLYDDRYYIYSTSDWTYDVESATFTAQWATVNVMTFEDINDHEVMLTRVSGIVTSEIVIPETYEGKTVVTIGTHAFAGRSTVTKITLPSTIKGISMGAFQNCTKLTDINIPEGITTIGNFIFQNCSSLESLTLPNSVTKINANAFEDCIGLSNITLSENLQTIDLYAFKGCISLANITIPNGVTYIGDSAFRGTGLTSISIPQSVTQLNKNAFADCENLTSVTFEATDGWFYTDNMSATSGTEINASDLLNPTTAAQYLTDTYCSYHWKRNVSE